MTSQCGGLRAFGSMIGSFFFIVILVHHTSVASVTASSSSPPLESPYLPPSRRRILLLDIDNTLYSERSAGIERQIVQGTHKYCQDVLGIDKDEADRLFHRYGSTVEGLKKTIWNNCPPKELEKQLDGFYRTVYDPVDVSSILTCSIASTTTTPSTGYVHAKDQGDTRLVRQLLMNWNQDYHSVSIASNSPSWHVLKVLRALGLAKLVTTTNNIDSVTLFTPDRLKSYPSKHEPKIFFALSEDNDNTLLTDLQHPVILLDDSLHNLQSLKQAFPTLVQRLYHICHDHGKDESCNEVDGGRKTTLVQALLEEAGLVDPSYEFNQVHYLEAKNEVDRQSIHVATWNSLIEELRDTFKHLQEQKEHYGYAYPNNNDDGIKNVESPSPLDLWIVDLGAGLLPILDLLLHGDDDCGLQSLLPKSPDAMISSSSSAAAAGTRSIHYTAYESNKELYERCHVRLLSWGFELVRQKTLNNGIDEATYQDRKRNMNVHLILRDFGDESNASAEVPEGTPIKSPHLIVGCCFADLLDPHQLVPSMIRTFHLLDPTPPKGTLVYFPITFAGVTQFVPARPFQFRGTRAPIPSDTLAFQSYATALEKNLGHNLNPSLLQDVMVAYGAKLRANCPSDWKIDPQNHPYLFETMLYFFGSTGGPQLFLDGGWDAAGWIRRAREQNPRPSIQVTNRDLLFHVSKAIRRNTDHPLSGAHSLPDSIESEEERIKEILFTEPYRVTSISKDFPTELGPRQVLIKSSHSLISSGTELKIFKGIFDDDAALDVNIKDMEGERMAYPLSYGYCLVGHVIDCGSEVPRNEFMNQLVFTFSPHASYVVTTVDAIQIVPTGIDAQDAIFMPSVETALSLVHDAHVRLGENVAVYGQGLIGLLVTALLSRSESSSALSGKFGTITVFDMIPDRLAMASQMGASQALSPGGSNGPFDVSIEVSGNARALQSAIDHTMDGGRVIVGSWYGNADIILKLGIDFHRSHKTIQTSQVSVIPANLSGLWSKERRFALTWELVKQIRPSRLLTATVTLDEAQSAYDALDKGEEVAVAFAYSNMMRS